MGAVLSNQLQSVMQEGLLDSLLPYLVRDKKLVKVENTISLIIFNALHICECDLYSKN